MKYKISGDNLQVANISLSKGDIVNAEAGAMVYRAAMLSLMLKVKVLKKL